MLEHIFWLGLLVASLSGMALLRMERAKWRK